MKIKTIWVYEIINEAMIYVLWSIRVPRLKVQQSSPTELETGRGMNMGWVRSVSGQRGRGV